MLHRTITTLGMDYCARLKRERLADAREHPCSSIVEVQERSAVRQLDCALEELE